MPLILLSQNKFNVDGLQVEYQSEPMGLDVTHPSFGWQMKSETKERGQKQTAYRITVRDEAGSVIWSSGKVQSGTSHNINYAGESLSPQTRYEWVVEVWNQENEVQQAGSWFETGLRCSSDQDNQWMGAKWIGAGAEDMVLYSHYLSVFKVEYSLMLDQTSGSTRASFIVGANDERLMHKDLNLMQVRNENDQAYIAFELDISALEKSDGQAVLNVYRVGYHTEDKEDIPFRHFVISEDLINRENRYKNHRFLIDCNFGLFDVYLNERTLENKISQDDPTTGRFASRGMNLNPIGRGNNFISFPMLADIGFKLAQNQSAFFSEVQIKHFRYPSNIIFSESLSNKNEYHGIFYPTVVKGSCTIADSAYKLNGGERGILITADPSHDSPPMLRNSFHTREKIKKARIYCTARGIYELYVNGQRISDDYFNPGLTQYNKTHHYQTYDVTEVVNAGSENVVGAWLSEGWWSGNITYSGENWNYFGDRQSFLCKMVITYEDNTEQTIVTDPENWKYYSEGPLRYGSFFQGEVYDARLENKTMGWSESGFSEEGWKPAVIIPLKGSAYQGTFTDFRGNSSTFNYDDFKIIGQVGPSATVVKELSVQKVDQVRPGVFVYDLGQNMVGFPRIKIKNGQKGQKIFLRYAEVKYPDLPDYQENVGMIMLENIRAALAQDVYILKGGDQIIQPRFTFHGFRFLEITGIEEAIPLQDIKGMVVSSVNELTSDYQTSNELVNKLWENITWSLRGNFLSIPTDTPARNERMGWSGDINVFSRAATFLAQVNQFLKRHLMAMRNIQRADGRFPDVAPVGGGFGGTLWGSAGITVAWETFLQYGDSSLLQEHYPSMKAYMEFLNSKIDPLTGVLNEGPLGDWLSPEGNKNDNTLFWAAYHAYDLEIMSKVAKILGKKEEAEIFSEKFRERKDFFNKTYVDPVTFKTVKSGVQTGFMGPPGASEADRENAKGKIIDTQASYAIPLAFDLFNEHTKPHIIQNFANTIERKNDDDQGIRRPEYSLMTGFIGTASLSEALSENGMDSLAYRILQQTSYPSWLYSVINGATTIWERLNSYTIEDGFGGNNSMNSFNHYSFGAVAAWMINYSLGIRRNEDSPAFKRFILNPRPDPDQHMTWAKGSVQTLYGKISSSWEWNDNQLLIKATIPANTSAQLILPRGIGNISESGQPLNVAKGITFISQTVENIQLNLLSGDYEFTIMSND
ncbi:MAG: family 78 glycoside hydrolase catalytic domain [Saprospiraceae bacterium]|nr:family 78 glycoside hydrolase catalytic domain [Saprospiraceae bacterium]